MTSVVSEEERAKEERALHQDIADGLATVGRRSVLPLS
jgi:hypothetical protein